MRTAGPESKILYSAQRPRQTGEILSGPGQAGASTTRRLDADQVRPSTEKSIDARPRLGAGRARW
jgi:hypothetical protein